MNLNILFKKNYWIPKNRSLERSIWTVLASNLDFWKSLGVSSNIYTVNVQMIDSFHFALVCGSSLRRNFSKDVRITNWNLPGILSEHWFTCSKNRFSQTAVNFFITWRVSGTVSGTVSGIWKDYGKPNELFGMILSEMFDFRVLSVGA